MTTGPINHYDAIERTLNGVANIGFNPHAVITVHANMLHLEIMTLRKDKTTTTNIELIDAIIERSPKEINALDQLTIKALVKDMQKELTQLQGLPLLPD